MRRILLVIGIAVLAHSSFGQPRPTEVPPGPPPGVQRPGPGPDGVRPLGPPRCCAKTYDATGKLIGDVFKRPFCAE